MIRLVYQRGAFHPAETAVVSTALFWFAFSLPTNGVYLLQTRTFFSLQRPWQATTLATLDLVVSAVAALALYKPFGVGGIVAGTGIGTTAAVVAQAVILRREFDGLELGRLFSTASRILIASAALAGVGWLVWHVLDAALGRGLPGQIVSLGGGLGVGLAVYVAMAKLLRVAELEQMTRLLRRR
jgi:putative peptidoglycan lipid II flippase